MEEKKVSTLFDEMRGDISNFISSTLELGKLEVYEKVSLGSSTVSYAMIVAGILLMALFFMLVTAALYLGSLFQNLWIGFGIVAAFTVILLLIVLLFKKCLKKKITNKVVRFLMAQEDKEDKKSGQ